MRLAGPEKSPVAYHLKPRSVFRPRSACTGGLRLVSGRSTRSWTERYLVEKAERGRMAHSGTQTRHKITLLDGGRMRPGRCRRG
jgi:hypothetical protein